MEHYPVDNIREKTTCELHVPVRNLSFKVANGYALSCEGNPLWHCNPIPAGYGCVGVDEIMEGYHDLELDIAGAEGERKLEEVGGGVILWKKEIHCVSRLATKGTVSSESPRFTTSKSAT